MQACWALDWRPILECFETGEYSLAIYRLCQMVTWLVMSPAKFLAEIFPEFFPVSYRSKVSFRVQKFFLSFEAKISLKNECIEVLLARTSRGTLYYLILGWKMVVFFFVVLVLQGWQEHVYAYIMGGCSLCHLPYAKISMLVLSRFSMLSFCTRQRLSPWRTFSSLARHPRYQRLSTKLPGNFQPKWLASTTYLWVKSLVSYSS